MWTHARDSHEVSRILLVRGVWHAQQKALQTSQHPAALLQELRVPCDGCRACVFRTRRVAVLRSAPGPSCGGAWPWYRWCRTAAATGTTRCAGPAPPWRPSASFPEPRSQSRNRRQNTLQRRQKASFPSAGLVSENCSQVVPLKRQSNVGLSKLKAVPRGNPATEKCTGTGEGGRSLNNFAAVADHCAARELER